MSNDGPGRASRRRYKPSEKREMALMWLEQEMAFTEIARECGCSWMTVKRAVEQYLTPETRERAIAERRATAL